MVSVGIRPPSSKGLPLFIRSQAQCATCGRVIEDPLTVEELGRYCSPRCYHGRELPALFRQGA